jgi:ribosome maturation protein Sdo1
VNSDTGGAFALSAIEHAMREDLHFAVNLAKPARPQAKEVILLLERFLPIARARLHLAAEFPLAGSPPSMAQLLQVAGPHAESKGKNT